MEATSATPFSARARDRALRGVLVSYARLDDPKLAQEQDANRFDPNDLSIRHIVERIADRAYEVTGREDVRKETELQLKNLLDEWAQAESPPAERPVVYTGHGLQAKNADAKQVLLRPMEVENGKGMWAVAGSLREVEPEVEIVLADEEGLE